MTRRRFIEAIAAAFVIPAAALAAVSGSGNKGVMDNNVRFFGGDLIDGHLHIPHNSFKSMETGGFLIDDSKEARKFVRKVRAFSDPHIGEKTWEPRH